MHQLSRAPDSITLSWPQPDRPNGDIIEYQLRYYDKVHLVSHTHTQASKHPNRPNWHITNVTTKCPSASLRVQMWTVQRVCTVRPTQWPSTLWFPALYTPSRSELEMNGATAPTATPSTSPRCLWVRHSLQSKCITTITTQLNWWNLPYLGSEALMRRSFMKVRQQINIKSKVKSFKDDCVWLQPK